MSLRFNDNFTYVEKDGKLSLTSILPDANEIYHFEGHTIEILKLMANQALPILKEKFEEKLQIKIDQADWQSFIDYCLDKKILKNE